MKAALARWVLGSVFVVASLGKIADPAAFAQAISNYGLLSSHLIPALAITLPWLEFIAGMLIILGFLSESSALILAVLSLTFGLAIVSALLRGLDIECGCFQESERISWLRPLFDAGLAALALGIARKGSGRWALDNRQWWKLDAAEEPDVNRL